MSKENIKATKVAINDLTDILIGGLDNQKPPEQIDELDYLDKEDLISQLKMELPSVYEANLANCRNGVIDNNFPSDRNIKWIIRQNREEIKVNERLAHTEETIEFLNSPLGQDLLKL